MNEVSSISLAVDSSRVVKAKADLQDFARAGGDVERSIGGMERAASRMGAAFSAALAGLTVGAIVQRADEFATMSARMRLATESAEAFAQAQAEVFRISQQTGTGLAATSGLFASLARDTESLGASQSQVLGVTQTISQVMVVSGASAQAAQAALVQLGQAFASGTLRGEELNSVLEQTPRLAKAIADGLGVTTGSLRTLGEQGALTSKDVFQALEKSAAGVRAEFEQMPMTVSRATTEAANSLLVLIGAADSATGSTAALADVISTAAGGMADLAEQIKLATTGQQTAATIAGGLVQAFVTASEAIRILYANVEFVFKATGREIGAVAAQIVALASLDISGFNAISRAVKEDAQRARAELDAFEQRVLNRYNFSDRAGAGRGTAPDPRSLGTPDPIPTQRRTVTAGGKTGGSRAGSKSNDADALARAQLAADLSGIRTALAEKTAAYQNSERALDALRQAGLIDERQFYGAKRELIAMDSAAQVAALEAEKARIAQRKATGAEEITQKQRIAEIESRIAIERADTAAKLYELDLQQANGLQKLAQGYAAAEQAARDLLEAQALQQDRSIAGIGMGDRDRERAQGRQQIEDRYLQQRQRLEEKRLTGQVSEQQYAEEMDRIRRFQSESLTSYESYYDRLIAAQGRWELGVARAFQNYADAAGNTADQVDRAMTSAAQGMEDALVNFVTTGKLSFNDLATSIVADITRIIIKQQIMVPLMQAMGMGGPGGGAGGGGGFLSTVFSSLFGGQRANGGPVSRGRMYEVNERGRPELLNVGGRQYLMATQSGSVNPNAGGAGAGVAQTNNFHISGQVDRRTQSQLAAKAGSAAQRALARNN